MTITRLDASAIDTVAALYKSAVQHMIKNNIFQWDDIYPDVDILKNDIIKGEMFAGVLDGEIVSCFVLNTECDKEYMDAAWNYRGKNFVILHRLCVKAERQNEGIGTKTMIEIERRVKNTGIQAIRLDTFSQNPCALNMYKKLGYQKTGQAHWRKGLFYLFEKQLGHNVVGY